MIDYNTKQTRELYSKLPEDLKEAIFSADVSNKIIDIGKKYKLAIDKVGILGSETSRVMLGVTHPNEFIANLAERLEADKEKARAIAQEINEQIFKPVRDSLRKIHNMREEGEEEQSQTHHLEAELPSDAKGEILKEIEKEHSEENNAPEIMRGSANPFEEKMKEGVLLAPVEEKHYIEEKPETALLPETEKPKDKYQGIDPYRESLE